GQHPRHRRRMVVVGAGGGEARPVAAVLVTVAVFHVGRVVVVGHDHGAATVAAGDGDQQVALLEMALLVAQPAARPGEVEVGLPAERQVAGGGRAVPAPGGG